MVHQDGCYGIVHLIILCAFADYGLECKRYFGRAPDDLQIIGMPIVRLLVNRKDMGVNRSLNAFI